MFTRPVGPLLSASYADSRQDMVPLYITSEVRFAFERLQLLNMDPTTVELSISQLVMLESVTLELSTSDKVRFDDVTFEFPLTFELTILLDGVGGSTAECRIVQFVP